MNVKKDSKNKKKKVPSSGYIAKAIPHGMIQVGTTADSKGNTWYEVDIPKNFMNIEWQFKSGGKVNKKSKLIKRNKL